MILGGLHDVFGGWATPLLLASMVTFLGAWSGMLAGRAVHL
jgi:cyanate permease